MFRIFQISVIAVLGVFALLFPELLERFFHIFSLFLVLFIGVPHGAADHLIFERSGGSFFGAKKIWSFILIYLLLGLAFLVIWVLSPFKAMILFILISIFHFGQEHFEALNMEKSLTKWSYFIWGSFVLLIPLAWHAETTAMYFFEISGVLLEPISMSTRIVIISTIFSLNVLTALVLWRRKMIDLSRLKSEVLQGALLLALFLFTPLILGFAVYFVFWHSLHAMQDQYEFLYAKSRRYSILQYLKDIAPLSFIAISFVLICGYLLMQYSQQSLFSYVFILIALITLPHILLFDRFYAQKHEMVDRQ